MVQTIQPPPQGGESNDLDELVVDLTVRLRGYPWEVEEIKELNQHTRFTFHDIDSDRRQLIIVTDLQMMKPLWVMELVGRVVEGD